MQDGREVKQIAAALPGHDLVIYEPPEASLPASYTADPIIAWALIREVQDGEEVFWVEPVTVDMDRIGYPRSSFVGPSAVRFPDGRVQEPDSICYATIEEWMRDKTRWAVWQAVTKM